MKVPPARAKGRLVMPERAKKRAQGSFEEALALSAALPPPRGAPGPLLLAPNPPPPARASPAPPLPARLTPAAPLPPAPRLEPREGRSAELQAPPAPGQFAAQLDVPARELRAEPRANAPLVELSLADPSLRISGDPGVLTVALQTQTSGALELEIRVHQGRTDVRIDGAGQLFADRAPELERVLAGEGLTLGHYSTGQQSHSGRDDDAPSGPAEPPERPGQSSSPLPGASVTTPSPRARHDGRIDVHA